MATSQQVRAHRRDLAELWRLAEIDLRILFRNIDTGEQARDALMDLLPQLVSIYGSAAATLGADWYDDLREQAAVQGSFTAVPAELPDRGRTDALARWSVAPLFQPDPEPTTALHKVAGGLQRIIGDADRGSVVESVKADPRGRGWQRHTSGGACDFCQMLTGRGAVYTEASSSFESHDHCGCIAVPVYI